MSLHTNCLASKIKLHFYASLADHYQFSFYVYFYHRMPTELHLNKWFNYSRISPTLVYFTSRKAVPPNCKYQIFKFRPTTTTIRFKSLKSHEEKIIKQVASWVNDLELINLKTFYCELKLKLYVMGQNVNYQEAILI